MLPAAARDFYALQQRVNKTARNEVRRLWRKMHPSDFEASWRRIGPAILAVVTEAQLVVAEESAAYVPEVLAQRHLPDQPQGRPVPSAFAGIASDGRPLDSLLYGAVVKSGQAFNMGATAQQALASGGQWLDMATGAQVADAARTSTQTWISARPHVGGYVRMLNTPSCSRCAALAGRFYKWNAGFQRHPHCDCIHIPSQEADYSDPRLSGDKWFHSLPESEQDRIFTKTGAQAVRDGADLGQVVNARRGMNMAGETSTTTRGMWVRKPDGTAVWEQRTVNVSRRSGAQRDIFGHDALITTEGTTSRGLAFKSLGRGGTVRTAEELATRITKNGPELRRVHRTRARSPRLMPESIYQIAKDREDAIRLLKAHGYLT